MAEELNDALVLLTEAPDRKGIVNKLYWRIALPLAKSHLRIPATALVTTTRRPSKEAPSMERPEYVKNVNILRPRVL